jgi:hypothetical protein
MDNFLFQCQPGIAQGQESSAAFQAKTDQQWSVHQAEQGKNLFSNTYVDANVKI